MNTVSLAQTIFLPLLLAILTNQAVSQDWPNELIHTENGITQTLELVSAGDPAHTFGSNQSHLIPLFDGTHNFNVPLSFNTKEGANASPQSTDPKLGTATLSMFLTSQGFTLKGLPPVTQKILKYQWTSYELLGPLFSSSTHPYSQGELLMIRKVVYREFDLYQPPTLIRRFIADPYYGGYLIEDVQSAWGLNGITMRKYHSTGLYRVK